MNDVLRAMWDGMRLRCPGCRKGPIYQGFYRMHRHCPVCATPFEREGEGDFLGAMVTAYAVTAVLVALIVYILAVFTEISTQALIWSIGVSSAVFIFVFYRYMKGMWVGILYSLLKWLS